MLDDLSDCFIAKGQDGSAHQEECVLAEIIEGVWRLADLLHFRNPYFIRDAVALNDADGVPEQSVAILGHRFRYRYRIASAVGVERAIYIDAVILHIA